MSYTASNNRYATMSYHRSGNSGLKLPALSLGLWHNFGSNGNYENMKAMCFTAFDHGITHFDLANNYGPEPGSAERNFGRILREELHAYRDELVISTKAGYTMWDGPYGDWGSRKYLLASLDQSLKRMGVDYVDIFYHHRMDPNTPLEESMMALDTAVKSGKALYAGISRYDLEHTRQAMEILKELKCPFIIHQTRYSIFDRHIETDGVKSFRGPAHAGKARADPRIERAGQKPRPDPGADGPERGAARRRRDPRADRRFQAGTDSGKPGDRRPHLLYRGRASGDRRDQPRGISKQKGTSLPLEKKFLFYVSAFWESFLSRYTDCHAAHHICERSNE